MCLSLEILEELLEAGVDLEDIQAGIVSPNNKERLLET